jgi:hypothetical protein
MSSHPPYNWVVFGDEMSSPVKTPMGPDPGKSVLDPLIFDDVTPPLVGAGKAARGSVGITGDAGKGKADNSLAVHSSSERVVQEKSVYSALEPRIQSDKPRVHVPNWGLGESDRFTNSRT